MAQYGGGDRVCETGKHFWNTRDKLGHGATGAVYVGYEKVSGELGYRQNNIMCTAGELVAIVTSQISCLLSHLPTKCQGYSLASALVFL